MCFQRSGYDVAATGGETDSDTSLPPLQFRVVLNWFEELKERVPVP